MVHKMTRLRIDQIKEMKSYLVSAADTALGVSFHGRVREIEVPLKGEQWVVHFYNGITLRVADHNATTFFVLEEGV